MNWRGFIRMACVERHDIKPFLERIIISFAGKIRQPHLIIRFASIILESLNLCKIKQLFLMHIESLAIFFSLLFQKFIEAFSLALNMLHLEVPGQLIVCLTDYQLLLVTLQCLRYEFYHHIFFKSESKDF